MMTGQFALSASNKTVATPEPRNVCESRCKTIKAHLKSNYPESEVAIGKVNSAKNVTRSANFQFFTDYNNTVFITNKFF